MKKISAPAAPVNATLSPHCLVVTADPASASGPLAATLECALVTHFLNKALSQLMHVNTHHLGAFHPLRL